MGSSQPKIGINNLRFT